MYNHILTRLTEKYLSCGLQKASENENLTQKNEKIDSPEQILEEKSMPEPIFSKNNDYNSDFHKKRQFLMISEVVFNFVGKLFKRSAACIRTFTHLYRHTKNAQEFIALKIEQIAAALGYSYRATLTAIQKLENAGLLLIKRRKCKSQKQLPSVYKITIPNECLELIKLSTSITKQKTHPTQTQPPEPLFNEEPTEVSDSHNMSSNINNLNANAFIDKKNEAWIKEEVGMQNGAPMLQESSEIEGLKERKELLKGKITSIERLTREKRLAQQDDRDGIKYLDYETLSKIREDLSKMWDDKNTILDEIDAIDKKLNDLGDVQDKLDLKLNHWGEYYAYDDIVGIVINTINQTNAKCSTKNKYPVKQTVNSALYNIARGQRKGQSLGARIRQCMSLIRKGVFSTPVSYYREMNKG